MRLVKVTVEVEVEPGVVDSHCFHLRDDLFYQPSVARYLAAAKLANAQVIQAFWMAYRTVTQPPADPPQTS